MTAPASPAQLREWSEQVARDPGSLAFFPLAEAYRRMGRPDVALRLCLRGLRQHPSHVDAHHLLGELYMEQGELTRAHDEWDIALRLDPEHSRARRELGLLCLRTENWKAALHHLEAAAASAPADVAVSDGLARARARLAPAERVPAPPPRAEANPLDRLRAGLRAAADARGIIGAVLLDDRGRVLAGTVQVPEGDQAPAFAAALAGIREDAEQAVQHLGLGAWQAIVVETGQAVVHLAPMPRAMAAVVAERRTPTGWLFRVAARVRTALHGVLADGAAG